MGLDFTEHRSRLVYAGVKLIVAIGFGFFYLFNIKFLGSAVTTKSGKLLGLFPTTKTKSKSALTMLTLIILSVYREKFELKISSCYEPGKLHFGRAMFTPFVYVSFTLLMILDQSLASFITATLYQLGFFYFYID